MRVATFNLWGGNEHVEAINGFLLDADADVVVLQEVQDIHEELLALLKKAYPYRVGTAAWSFFPSIGSSLVGASTEQATR